MRRLLTILALTAVTACRSTSSAPDLILLNGKVFTSDDARPWAEAVAIRGERISAVGTSDEIRRMAGTGTRVIDVAGRTVVAGINDAHVHEPWGISEVDLGIAREASVDQILDLVAKATKSHPPGTWLTGDVPADEEFETSPLTREALDAVAPDHPIRLSNLAGHVYLLNSAGLRAWGIREDIVDPPGGRYGRREGRLSGLMYEHAGWGNMRNAQAREPDDTVVQRILDFSDRAIRFGITSVQSMPSDEISRMRTLASRANVPLRWRWMGIQMAVVEEMPAGPMKYILDGTPIERGAALREPYSDRPAESGRMNYTDAQVQKIVEVAAGSGQPLLVHIAGDVALEKVFRAMHRVPADWPAKRVRIEHGDFIGTFLEDAKQVGVVLVQNPAHFMFSEIMAARLGPRFMTHMQLRTPLERGIPVAIGSDGPLNPWLNVMFASIHPGHPNEAITREQAVKAYTRGSAYAEFAEKEKGTIATGMLADIAVLSQDVFAVPPSELPKTESVLTIVGGKVVYAIPTPSVREGEESGRRRGAQPPDPSPSRTLGVGMTVTPRATPVATRRARCGAGSDAAPAGRCGRSSS